MINKNPLIYLIVPLDERDFLINLLQPTSYSRINEKAGEYN